MSNYTCIVSSPLVNVKRSSATAGRWPKVPYFSIDLTFGTRVTTIPLTTLRDLPDLKKLSHCQIHTATFDRQCLLKTKDNVPSRPRLGALSLLIIQ